MKIASWLALALLACSGPAAAAPQAKAAPVKPSALAPSAVLPRLSGVASPQIPQPGPGPSSVQAPSLETLRQTGSALTQAPALAGESLQTLYAGASRARNITVGTPLASADVVTVTEYVQHVRPNYKDYARRHLLYQDSPAVAQEMLLPEDYSGSERRLISKLKKLSQKKKFRARAYAAAWQVRYELYAEAALSRGISEAELREFAASPLELSDNVEAGAWRMELKDGRVLTAPHSSSKNTTIRGDHLSDALYGVLERNGAGWKDIAMIQYFHTHPGIGPLSSGDQNTAFQIAAAARDMGLDIPVHEYAIELKGDFPITFHLGLQPSAAPRAQ